jgi:ferredoxin-type protein NapH
MFQVSVLLLFVAGNAYGWKILQGDLSSSRVLGAVPLSDPYALLQVLFTGTIVSAEALIGGAIILLFFAAAGGRTFCAWVCPMNMVTDLAERLRDAAGIDRLLPGAAISRKVRYGVLVVSLVLSSVLGVAAFEWISPISMLHRGVLFGMGAGWTMVVAVFLFDLVMVRQGFCGHLCPLGGFYALIGRGGVVRVRHRADRCSRCAKCLEYCPEPQVLPMIGKQSGFVSSGECTNCGRCIEVCPDDALRFGMRLLTHKTGEQKGG